MKRLWLSLWRHWMFFQFWIPFREIPCEFLKERERERERERETVLVVRNWIFQVIASASLNLKNYYLFWIPLVCLWPPISSLIVSLRFILKRLLQKTTVYAIISQKKIEIDKIDISPLHRDCISCAIKQIFKILWISYIFVYRIFSYITMRNWMIIIKKIIENYIYLEIDLLILCIFNIHNKYIKNLKETKKFQLR